MINHKNLEDISFIASEPAAGLYTEATRDLFWPFYLWRVLGKKVEEPLNVFQLLLLKLVKAGCTENDKLVEYCNLDKELVKYILAELINEGYLQGWKLTEKAHNLLNGKEVSSSETCVYYIVQDATTGKLLPRMLTTIPYIDQVSIKEGKPCFVKNRSTGNEIRPYLINTVIPAVKPTVEHVLDSMRGYRRAIFQLDQIGELPPEDDINIDSSIEFIEDNAIPIYCNLSLFSTVSGERSWYISDPTGLTHSLPELNEIAEQLLKKNKGFSSRIDDMLGIADSIKVTSYQEKVRYFEEKAKTELFSSYSWASENEIISKHVLAMLRFKIQAEEETKPHSELLEALLSELQKVIEAWLKSFIKPDKKNTDWHVLVSRWNGDKPIYQQNKALIKEIYLRVEGVSELSAKSLSTVNAGTLRSALTFSGQSLKPMLSALLLSNPNVFIQINQQLPEWLDAMVCLANDRNSKASHANGQYLTKEDAFKHVKAVDQLLTVLEKLLGN